MTGKILNAVLSLILILTVGSLGLLTGCSDNVDKKGKNMAQTKTPSDDRHPGMKQLADGRTEAKGILVWRDLEGGFWALADTTDANNTTNVKNIAVLRFTSTFVEENGGVGLDKYDNQYVRVIGSTVEGMSFVMAGPEINVKTIEVILPNNSVK